MRRMVRWRAGLRMPRFGAFSCGWQVFVAELSREGHNQIYLKKKKAVWIWRNGSHVGDSLGDSYGDLSLSINRGGEDGNKGTDLKDMNRQK